MRRYPKVAFAVASFVAAGGAASSARAGGMDPTPERLYMQPPGLPIAGPNGPIGCQEVAANPNLVVQPGSPFPANSSPNQFACQPNNVAWANLMSELGMAIAPTAFHAARTTGLGGFSLSLEASYTHINANATAGGVQYWHDGTQGNVDPNTHRFSTTNTAPDSLLQVYLLKARKGLAYGFEIAGALGTMANSSLWVGGGDVRWALLEGYRTGILGYLPDVAIGSGVRTLGGSPKFFLTTVGIDAQLSKPITLGDSAVLTPYIGGQRVIIFADSSTVDLTPTVDPLKQCGWLGANVPGNPYAKAPYDGTPVCQNKLVNNEPNNSDFNNDRTFNKARIHRWRALAGVNYRYEILYLAGQFAMDLTEPSAENNDLGISGSRQWTISLEAGVFF
ncbi:MAG TPA: hypothetical protein VKU41_14935 [Polyangiaceae bacterium]|nr:hypothetical protein [Polyangiaceae bacterium]